MTHATTAGSSSTATETSRSGPSRRTFVKGVAATGAVLAVQPSVQTVAATSSGEPELTTEATVPADGEIRITVSEYEAETGGDATGSDSATIEGGTNTYQLDGLDGEESYYDFEVEMGTDGESPELESMTLELPETGADDEEESEDEDDEEDEDDGGWFSFDFWPFSDDGGLWPFSSDDETEDGEDDEEECDGIEIFGFCLFGGN